MKDENINTEKLDENGLPGFGPAPDEDEIPFLTTGELKDRQANVQAKTVEPGPDDEIPLDEAEDSEQPVEIKDDRKWTFTIIENAILENEKVTRLGLLVYIALCFYANNQDHTCFPKVKTLGKIARLKDSSVKTGLRELENLGIINVLYRKDPSNPKKNLSNLYTIQGVGQTLTQGRSSIDPGVGQPLTPNYTNTELDPINEKVEVSRAVPDLHSLTLFSKENPVFKDIKEKDWKSIIKAAMVSQNDLRDVLIYVNEQFERGKPIKNVGGYIHRCLVKNWSIDFKDGDPWYAYYSEHDTSWKDKAKA